MVNTNRSRLASVARARKNEGEGGFTLLEVLIGLMLVTLLALFALPLMASGIRYASIASTTTAANSRVQQAVEQGRSSPVTCQSLTAVTGTRTYLDGRGNSFRVQVTLPSGCTVSTSAQAVPMRIVATRARDNMVLTQLTTRILVPGTTTP